MQMPCFVINQGIYIFGGYFTRSDLTFSTNHRSIPILESDLGISKPSLSKAVKELKSLSKSNPKSQFFARVFIETECFADLLAGSGGWLKKLPSGSRYWLSIISA